LFLPFWSVTDFDQSLYLRGFEIQFYLKFLFKSFQNEVNVVAQFTATRCASRFNQILFVLWPSIISHSTNTSRNSQVPRE